MGNHGAASARARSATPIDGANGSNGRNGLNGSNGSTSVKVTRPQRGTLSNWPVSRRLFAVIALALVMGLVFGGLRIASAEDSSAQFGRVSQLASLGQEVTILIQDLQDERDTTIGLLTSPDNGSLTPLFANTNVAVARVRSLASGVGSSFPANIQTDVATVLADISPAGIAELHGTLGSSQDVFAVIADYAVPISDMITLNDQIAQGTSDAALASDVRTLNVLSQAKEQASQQRALLFSLFNDTFWTTNNPTTIDGDEQSALSVAYSEELVDEAAFQSTSTPSEQTAFTDALGARGAGLAEEIEDFVFADLPDGTGPRTNPLTAINSLGFKLNQAPGKWYSAMSAKINAMQTVVRQVAANISARAQSLQQGAQKSALVIIVITVAVLLLVMVAALLVARSLVRPLRRLRAGALDIATVQLPQRVMQLSESPDPTANVEVAPIDVLTADEIGQVARAFDQVHAEAVRLAGNEAMLRTSFNAMFVNLSRRSQSLIERLARMIDSLEQNEDDPDRLSSLFSMDHLVTRMRRNSENLLLLAGHEGARKWSEPVALADVLRAATSEIEQYSRVMLNIQPGVAVIGQAVSDVVHLLAELIENATLFSPKDTQVQVTAQELSSGGVLIEVSDKGIGVSEARLGEMNWRLDNTPAMDVSVSRHMGLFAVARLADRHGIRVRLRPALPQGLTALVWLPDSVIERMGRGYPSAVGWSQPFAAEGGLAARRPGGGSIGTRSALDGRRAAVGAGPAQLDSGLPAGGPEDPQSNWFRSRRISATGVGAGTGLRGGQDGGDPASGAWPTVPAPPQESGWSSGTDSWAQQRHAAEIIADPVRGDQTSAGLPVRVPKANLLPGSAGGARPAGAGRPADLGQPGQPGQGQPLTSPLPQRSPELARNRLSGFQRGARRAESRQQPPGEGADS